MTLKLEIIIKFLKKLLQGVLDTNGIGLLSKGLGVIYLIFKCVREGVRVARSCSLKGKQAKAREVQEDSQEIRK